MGGKKKLSLRNSQDQQLLYSPCHLKKSKEKNKTCLRPSPCSVSTSPVQSGPVWNHHQSLGSWQLEQWLMSSECSSTWMVMLWKPNFVLRSSVASCKTDWASAPSSEKNKRENYSFGHLSIVFEIVFSSLIQKCLSTFSGGVLCRS